MSVIVTDRGFAPEDHTGPVLTLAPDADPPAAIAPGTLVRVRFDSFADGRGFSLARALRAQGYAGRLRAAGHVLADQYAMARRAGFDEVEIPGDLALRQPVGDWHARADWRRHDHRSRLGMTVGASNPARSRA